MSEISVSNAVLPGLITSPARPYTPRTKHDRISIRATNNADELEQLYAFRYRIYVEEMRRTQKDADHARKVIQDPLDEHGVNIAAFVGDIVGVVRMNYLDRERTSYYEKLYRTGDFGAARPAEKGIVTRLMIAPHLRKGTLAVRLCMECYRLGLDSGVKWAFIDCNDHLIGFFSGLGFNAYMGKVLHDEYGEVTPMCLDLLDGDRLSSIQSPFSPVYDQWHRNRLDQRAKEAC